MKDSDRLFWLWIFTVVLCFGAMLFLAYHGDKSSDRLDVLEAKQKLMDSDLRTLWRLSGAPTDSLIVGRIIYSDTLHLPDPDTMVAVDSLFDQGGDARR